jgi:subtilase family serine protease
MANRSRFLSSALVLSSAATLAACSSAPSTPAGTSETSSSITSAVAPRTRGLDVPAWATTERYAGRLEAGSTVSVQVHLQMRNLEAARAELAEVSNPKSDRYGEFLSDAAFDAKYGPSDGDVAAVRAHLEKSGLRVTSVPGNRAYVAAVGAASQVEQAFGTRLGKFAINGKVRRAPLEAATLPADVASRVSAVLGLATPHKAKPALVRPITPRPITPSDRSTPGTACSTYWAQYVDTTDAPFGPEYATPSTALCQGYIPSQLRESYGFADVIRAGIDGTGQNIAIVDAWESPTLLSDAQQYAANNDPEYPFAPAQLVEQWAPGAPVDDPGDAQDWYGEEGLDVEAAHALAPKATIQFVAAQSDDDTDLIAALNAVITNHLATVVSNSWGEYEAYEDAGTIAAYEQVLLQGALKGISFFFASGDNGDQALVDEVYGIPTGPTASFPSSLAEVTSVGATSLALGAHNERVFEVGWETGLTFALPPGYQGSWLSYLETGTLDAVPGAGEPEVWWPADPGGYYFGSGGGTSVLYAQPAYQEGVVPASLASVGGSSWRVQPDVSMLGDPFTGYQVGETYQGVYSESPIGGTSLASPLFTASIALAQQIGGRHYGAINSLLYFAADLGAFRDIRPLHTSQDTSLGGGTLVTFDFRGPGNTLATAPGFDNVTGLGTPDGALFLAALQLPAPIERTR